MSFNMNMIAHVRAINDSLARFGARAEFRFPGFRLEIRANGRYYEFIPQYAIFQNGKMQYTPIPSPEVTHFIGWRHYFNRQWELSNDKLSFKRYCESNELNVPQLFMEFDRVNKNVIVKRKLSSFGDGITGPFLPEQVKAWTNPLSEDGYLEEFIRGDIAKIWYWNDKVVALEVKPMVEVVGDGQASLRQLVSAIASRFMGIDWSAMDAIAQYHGMSSVDDIVPDQQVILVEFRYLSGFHPFQLVNQNVLDRYE